ncbi:MAG TPA: hypothetical protein VNI83_02055 [Vicinamibacterales bacterium]|nr:hypothetical protein [Vicinamibacterales bacterium]
MPTPTARHLVAVWNPSLAADSMEAHVAVLLDALRRHDGAGDRDSMDDVYVWWGRVRSQNRQGPLPHLDEILALDHELGDEDGRELHLYLTDYRSLYVGHVCGITAQDVRTTDPDHVPAYYRERDLVCDCWFQLWDIRRLIQDDTLGVVAELKKLRNVRYHDKPVSIYGGMVDLPLVVRREDDVRWFDPVERERLLGNELWVEFDARQSGLGAMERELRDNLFGASAWSALGHGTRTFIATAERIFRDNRASAAFDFAPVVTGFAKALELEVNQRLRRGLGGARSEERMANLEGRTVDLAAAPNLALGQLARAIGGERAVNEALARRLHHGPWFANQLPAVLDRFAEVRNEGTHAARIDRDTATHWRDRLLGVGCEGVFVELARVRAKK